MGEGFLQQADALNKRGYYEDLRFQRISKSLAGAGYQYREPAELPEAQERALRQLVQRRSEEHDMWGFKGPRTAWTLHLLLPIIEEYCEVKVVVVRRPWGDVVDSMQRHSAIAYGGQHVMTQREAAHLLGDWQEALERRLEIVAWPTHLVEYHRLLKSPEKALRELEVFVFGDNAGRIDEAMEWVDPGMANFANRRKPTVVIPTLDAERAQETADLARERAGVDCRVVIAEDPQRRGFTSNVNDAVEGLRGYICLLNDDCEPSQDWLRVLVEELEKRQKLNVWFAGPSGPCRTRPQNQGRRGDQRRPRTVKHVAGFCLLIRPGVWGVLGGLDDSFVHYASEVDMQWRARRDYSARSLWVPEVFVDHELHPPLSEWWARDQTILHNKWR
jgi:hypothetical protein